MYGWVDIRIEFGDGCEPLKQAPFGDSPCVLTGDTKMASLAHAHSTFVDFTFAGF